LLLFVFINKLAGFMLNWVSGTLSSRVSGEETMVAISCNLQKNQLNSQA